MTAQVTWPTVPTARVDHWSKSSCHSKCESSVGYRSGYRFLSDTGRTRPVSDKQFHIYFPDRIGSRKTPMPMFDMRGGNTEIHIMVKLPSSTGFFPSDPSLTSNSRRIFTLNTLNRAGGAALIIMHCRSRMTIHPRIPTMLGRSTSGFRRP